MLNEFGADIWLFTNDLWITRNPDGEYVAHEKLAIRADPTIVGDFAPYLASACKIVGASRMRHCCSVAKLRCKRLWARGHRGAVAELLSRRHSAGP